jgi:hypothetical protein
MNFLGSRTFGRTTLFVAAALALQSLWAPASLAARKQSGPFISYEGDFGGDLAGHLHTPQDLASQKLQLSLNQKAVFSPEWRTELGFSAWDETSFATVPSRYTGSVIRDDSRDLRLRNAFVQYKSDLFFLRVGNQQVVWGEAFGFFYSDIINPKDLRYGLFGEFSDIRLQTPMVNAKLTLSNFSLQAIGIPKPYFNIVPSPGNDFAYPFYRVLPIPNIQINRETSLPIGLENAEAGARASYLIDRLDLSVFYFNYYDRDPWYVIDSSTQLPTSLVLDERHSRVQSYGLTATDDFGGFVMRLEALTTRKRVLPIVVPDPVYGITLSTTQLDDYIYVVGIDIPTWEKWNLGFQWSQDILSQNVPGLLRDRIISLASVRLQRPLAFNHSLELLYTYSTRDHGQRGEFNYLIPLSGNLETRFGFDVLGGPASAIFGQNYEATRGFISLKYYLRGRS